jgi:hypothetical protein
MGSVEHLSEHRRREAGGKVQEGSPSASPERRASMNDAVAINRERIAPTV